MGLNCLLHQHQLALMKASVAPSREARLDHTRSAFAVAHRIDALIQSDRPGAQPLVPLS